MSHLYALYPGEEWTPEQTPESITAARRSIEFRLANGGGHTGWSRAWLLNFFARLGDGAKVGESIQLQLAKSTLPNLLDDHPPFQIDGNFGHAAGVAECLLQSHLRQSKGKGKGLRVIELLPSLPSQWSKGKVTGLLARGGVTVDITWEEGRVKLARLVAVKDITVILKSAKTEKVLILKKGKAVFYQP